MQNLASPVFQEKYLSPHAAKRQVPNEKVQETPPPTTSEGSIGISVFSKPAGDDKATLRKVLAEIKVEEEQTRVRKVRKSDNDRGDDDNDDDDEDEDEDEDDEEDHKRVNQDYDFSDVDDDEDLWDRNHGRLFHLFKQTEEDDQDNNFKHRSRQDVNRFRYEITHWTYHLSGAQKLWSWEEQKSNASWEAIWKFLVKFMCEDTAAFESW